MKPKAFIFDFFGVICSDIAGDWFKTHIVHGSLEELEGYLEDADLGNVNETETFAKIGTSVGGDGEMIRNDWLRSAVIRQDMVRYVLELKKTYKVAVCTNAPKDFFYTVLKKEGIEDLFNVVVVSSEVGYAKPDVKIFDITLQKLGTSKEETVFFDDRQKNVDSGKMYGLQAVLFTTPLQIKEYISLT